MKMREIISLVGAVCIMLLITPMFSHAVVYLDEDFNEGDMPYSFDESMFGYSNDPYETEHTDTGGVNGSGAHIISLGGPSRTNFSCYVGKYVPNLREFYLRYYLWVNADFRRDGENWKLAYNYTEGGTGFVFWFRATDDNGGYQPAFFTTAYGAPGSLFKNQNLPTFYLPDFREQWITFEYYYNIDTGNVKLWITTEDGRYDQSLYIDDNMPTTGNGYNLIRPGSYWDGVGDYNYFKMDEMIISDTYNGPLGHTGGPPPPPPPDFVSPDSPSSLSIMGTGP